MMERTGEGPTVGELLREKSREAPALPAIVSVTTTDQVGAAVDLFQRYGISQLPVVRRRDGEAELDLSAIVGSVHERDILERVFRDADATRMPVSAVMGAPLGVVRSDSHLEEVYGDLQERPAVVVADGAVPVGVLTRADLLEYLAHRSRA
jgi:cystathionine beta-synthase